MKFTLRDYVWDIYVSQYLVLCCTRLLYLRTVNMRELRALIYIHYNTMFILHFHFKTYLIMWGIILINEFAPYLEKKNSREIYKGNNHIYRNYIFLAELFPFHNWIFDFTFSIMFAWDVLKSDVVLLLHFYDFIEQLTDKTTLKW